MEFINILLEDVIVRFASPPLSKIENILRKISDNERLNFIQLTKSYQLGKIESASRYDLEEFSHSSSEEEIDFKREINTLLKAFKQNNAIEAPVVLMRKNEKPLIIYGYAKLVCMKRMKILPSFFRVDYE